MRQRSMRALLGGAAVYPIVALALVNSLDQMHDAAFGVVLPEITADLHIALKDVAWLTLPPAALGLFMTLTAGTLGDRLNRVRMSAVGALVWGVCALLTSTVRSLGALSGLRAVSTLAVSVNAPAHGSLISDLYPPRGRGFAMGIWSGLRPFGAVAGSLVGAAIAARYGWRLTFVVLSVPMILAVASLLRVREPARGAHELSEGAARHASTVRLGPLQSLKVLFTIRSYRRLMVASSVIGLGSSAIVPLSAYFYAGVFGIGVMGRGAIAALSAAVIFTASLAGGPWLQRLPARRVALINGVLISTGGVVYILMASAPTALVAVAISLVGAAGFGVFSVGVFLQISSTTPAHLRSMAFAGQAVFFVLGSVWLPTALGIATESGMRIAILASAPFFVVGGLVVAEGSRFVQRDVDRANVVLRAEAEARRQREAGERLDLLRVEGLDVAYGNVQVLFGVDVRVQEGELVALLGTNGAGKSTLLRTVSGLIQPSDGAVLFDGHNITGFEAHLVASRGIVHVPGGRGVFPGLTVERNLRLGTYLLRGDDRARRDGVEEALDTFPRLRERLHQQAGTLSGGEQQMLNLAQAMMARPRLLLIDELSLGLAPRVVEEILQVVERIHASGVTIVLVEQSVNIALQLATRAYFMEKGEVRFEGRSADLADRDDLIRSVFLAGTR
jgi:ABC-type branched-subunit amino acid transport system ATPase component/predicted MFS family arabinose efflux permease